ncbi:hypothetical protein DENSPDRAFT_882720 [Dentipellis sp. KUC8613]|nr:hypothetical protein DENSPDRAFT_882720 [Dentipellis sp. KUC8613]
MSTRFRSSVPQWSQEARTEHAAEVHATLSARIDQLSRQNATLQEDLAAEQTKQAAFGPALLATVATLRRRHARAWASVRNILEESEEQGTGLGVGMSRKQKEREEGRERRRKDVDSLLFASCRDLLDLEMVLRDFCDEQFETGPVAVRSSDVGAAAAAATPSTSEIWAEGYDPNNLQSQDDGAPCSNSDGSGSGSGPEEDRVSEFPSEFGTSEVSSEELESQCEYADWEKREPAWSDQDLWNSNKHMKIRKAERSTPKAKRPLKRKPKGKKGRGRAYSMDE